MLKPSKEEQDAAMKYTIRNGLLGSARVCVICTTLSLPSILPFSYAAQISNHLVSSIFFLVKDVVRKIKSQSRLEEKRRRGQCYWTRTSNMIIEHHESGVSRQSKVCPLVDTLEWRNYIKHYYCSPIERRGGGNPYILYMTVHWRSQLLFIVGILLSCGFYCSLYVFTSVSRPHDSVQGLFIHVWNCHGRISMGWSVCV